MSFLPVTSSSEFTGSSIMLGIVQKTVFLSLLACLMFLFSSSSPCSSPFHLLFFGFINHSTPFLTFACSFLFNPPFPLRPTCQWFKDGVKLTEKNHQINNKDRTLTVKSASPDDNGLYYCCAKNAAGHVCSNSNFTLNVIGVYVFCYSAQIYIMLH